MTPIIVLKKIAEEKGISFKESFYEYQENAHKQAMDFEKLRTNLDRDDKPSWEDKANVKNPKASHIVWGEGGIEYMVNVFFKQGQAVIVEFEVWRRVEIKDGGIDLSTGNKMSSKIYRLKP